MYSNVITHRFVLSLKEYTKIGLYVFYLIFLLCLGKGAPNGFLMRFIPAIRG